MLRTQLHDLHFFQNCGHFQYYISWLCFDVSWCCIENDYNFERNEDRATVFLKWADFNTFSSTVKVTLELLYFLYKLVAMVLTKKDTKAAKTIGSLTYFSNNIKHHFEPRGYKVSSGFTKKSFQNPDASSQVISFKLSLTWSSVISMLSLSMLLREITMSYCHLLPCSTWNLQINYSYAK